MTSSSLDPARGPNFDPHAARPSSPDQLTAEEAPVVGDTTFMENVREALSNGYERVCAHCGIGTAGDDMDIHERRCPEFDERVLR